MFKRTFHKRRFRRRYPRCVYACKSAQAVQNPASEGGNAPEIWTNAVSTEQFDVVPATVSFFLGRNKLKLHSIQMYWRMAWLITPDWGGQFLPHFGGWYLRKVSLTPNEGVDPEDASVNPFDQPPLPSSITDWDQPAGMNLPSILTFRGQWGPQNSMIAPSPGLVGTNAAGTTTNFATVQAGGVNLQGTAWFPQNGFAGGGQPQQGGVTETPVRDMAFMDFIRLRHVTLRGDEAVRLCVGMEVPPTAGALPFGAIQLEGQFFWRVFAY